MKKRQLFAVALISVLSLAVFSGCTADDQALLETSQNQTNMVEEETITRSLGEYNKNSKVKRAEFLSDFNARNASCVYKQDGIQQMLSEQKAVEVAEAEAIAEAEAQVPVETETVETQETNQSLIGSASCECNEQAAIESVEIQPEITASETQPETTAAETQPETTAVETQPETTAAETTASVYNGTLYEDRAREAFTLVNQYRREAGVPELSWNDTLYQAAQTRAKEVSVRLEHTRPNGESYSSVLAEVGLSGSSAENIGWGTGSLGEAAVRVEGWYNSEGHRTNMLNSKYTQGAIACYFDGTTYYYVNLFLQ